jgi:hypothetical protein
MLWRRPSVSPPGGLRRGASISHDRYSRIWRHRASHERIALLALWALLAGPLSAGCRCSSEGQPAAVVKPSVASAPECERGSVQLTLAASSAASEPAEPPLDPDVELPFATEPGMALSARAGFFATGLKHEPRGAVALLGRVGADDAPTELVELGRIHGEVLPPRLAGDAGDLWVVLQDGTAAGRELRVAHFEGNGLGAPRWRLGPLQPNAESSAFDIAASGDAALLVYEDWSAADRHGRILAARVAREPAGEQRLEGSPVTQVGSDAEAPRVSARPGGYWLAWLVNAPAPAAGRATAGSEEASEPTAPDAYATRWLSVARLDPGGAIRGPTVRLTGKSERVVGFDLTTSPTGAAWLSWRQDAPTPGASGGRVFVAEVREDGGRDSAVVRDADVGSGEPTWLYAGDDPVRWLTFPDARDRTLLMRVRGWGRVGPPLRLGPELGRASALAASGQRVLFAAPRGKALELFPARCISTAPEVSDAGVPRAADAGAGSPRP